MEFFATLLGNLHRSGLEVHIAQPDCRQLFSVFSGDGVKDAGSRIPGNRLHLARDRAFYYIGDPEVNHPLDNIKFSLAFQREVIHHLIPETQPDIIHCYDWMSGLIPAAARRLGIPCLFTIYDVRSAAVPLWLMEDMGLDAAWFWEDLFYDRMPCNYEETRTANPADLLMSGVYAADFVSAASKGFRAEVVVSRNRECPSALSRLLREKCDSGCVSADCDEARAAKRHVGIYRKLLGELRLGSAN